MYVKVVDQIVTETEREKEKEKVGAYANRQLFRHEVVDVDRRQHKLHSFVFKMNMFWLGILSVE